MGTDKDAVPVHAATLQQTQDGTARRDALPLGHGRDPDGETHDKRDKGKVREGEEGAGASVRTPFPGLVIFQPIAMFPRALFDVIAYRTREE